MTYEPDFTFEGKDLVPEELMFPGALTADERRDITDSLNRAIAHLGIVRQLQMSLGTNISEFKSTMAMMFEKIRTDIQPILLNMIRDLINVAQSNQVSFLENVDGDFQRLLVEVQGLRGTVSAHEKLKELKAQQDRDHLKLQQELLNETEELAKRLIENVMTHEFNSDPQRRALAKEVKALATTNGELKQAMAEAYRTAQDIRWLDISGPKDRLLKILGSKLGR